MPSEFGPEEESGTIRIASAPVLDFQFGLFLLAKHYFDPGKSVPMWAIEVVAEHRPLIEDLTGFWQRFALGDVVPGTRYREWGELLVAAWATGTLLTEDVDACLDAAESAFVKGIQVPALDSEPAEVQDLIARRTRLLHENAPARAEFLALVRSTWALVQPHWERVGRDAAELAARDLRARARQSSDIRVLLPGNTYLHKESFQARISNANSRNELIIVPLGLAGGGQFYWAFPDVVLLGAGVDNAEREALRRERSERAANRLKVLSDPTRVAILHELLRGSAHHSRLDVTCDHPATVTELASLFQLSQPTVSVHVKMLREAGLIFAERDGNQVYYHAEEAGVRSYMSAALDDILGLTTSLREPVDAALALASGGIRPGF